MDEFRYISPCMLHSIPYQVQICLILEETDQTIGEIKYLKDKAKPLRTVREN